MVMSLTVVDASWTTALETVSHVSVCFLCARACISMFMVLKD